MKENQQWPPAVSHQGVCTRVKPVPLADIQQVKNAVVPSIVADFLVMSHDSATLGVRGHSRRAAWGDDPQ